MEQALSHDTHYGGASRTWTSWSDACRCGDGKHCAVVAAAGAAAHSAPSDDIHCA